MAEFKTDAWMPLWIGAYLADTQHLSRDEHGAYLLLLMAYWRSGAALPDDDKRLAAIAKASPKEWRGLRVTMAEFFVVAGGVWSHKRVDQELKISFERKKKAESKAKKGAQARWGHEEFDATSNATSMPQAMPKDMPKQCPTPSPLPFTKEDTHSLSLAQGCVSVFENMETENQIQVDSGRIARALDLVGLPSVSPQHPELLSWIAKGVTEAQFVDAARLSVGKGKGFAYMLGIIGGQMRDAGMVEAQQFEAKKSWNSDPKSVAEMAEKLNLKPWQKASSENAFRGEAYTEFLMRVTAAYHAANEVAA